MILLLNFTWVRTKIKLKFFYQQFNQETNQGVTQSIWAGSHEQKVPLAKNSKPEIVVLDEVRTFDGIPLSDIREEKVSFLFGRRSL